MEDECSICGEVNCQSVRHQRMAVASKAARELEDKEGRTYVAPAIVIEGEIPPPVPPVEQQNPYVPPLRKKTPHR